MDIISTGPNSGMHVIDTCGYTSKIIYKIYGHPFDYPSFLGTNTAASYWYLNLPISYFLSCVVVKIIKGKGVK
jgi:hypothetical protein